MADEKAPSKAQQFLMEHGEKVGLGAAVGLLVIYAVMGIALAEPNKSADAVKRSSDAIEQQANSSHPDKAAPPYDAKSPIHENTVLDLWQKLPENASSPSDWSVAVRTAGEGKENLIEKVSEKPVLWPSVAGLKADPGLDGVKLSWTVSIPEPTDKKEEVAKVDGFKIERKDKTTNKTETFTKKDPKATAYPDTTAQKRGSYEYRVTMTCKSKSQSKDFQTGWVAATMVDEWSLTFVNPTPGTPGGSPGFVQIKIDKFDKEYGAVSFAKLHKEGQKIGVWEEELEKKEKNRFGEMETVKYKADTGLHRVSVAGKSVWVDFDTKCTLNKIVKLEVAVKWNKCKLKHTSGGGADCEGVEPMEDKVDVIDVQYTDADNKPVSIKMRNGKEVKMVSDTEMDASEYPTAMAADRCEKHGGKKVEVDPDKEKKEQFERDAQKALGEAKVQQKAYEDWKKKAEKAEKDGKKDDATKFKAEADKAKQAAIDKYKKWLEEYKDSRYFKTKEKEVNKDLKELGG